MRAYLAALLVVGCALEREGTSEVGATAGSGGGTTSTSDTVSSSTTQATVGAGGGTSVSTGGSGGVGPDGCYTEGYDPGVSLTDLDGAYRGGQWLPTMLEALDRRYDNGWFVLDAMQTDPWLIQSFPGYFSLESFLGMIESIDTACHEETHGYDFAQALSLTNAHLYYMGSNLQVTAPKLDFFPRNAILAEVTTGGSVTSSYDGTYLTGTQGSYDFIFLADELTAYINGLACATAVGDHITGGHSYRDGAASHLYYLLAYLHVARAAHPMLYASWQADADWQKFVRYSWARGHFWTTASAVNPALGINDAAIWQRINEPANLQEIALFTGEDPAVVACTP